MAQRIVSEAPGMRAIDIGDLVKAKQLHSGWDDEYQTYVLDEDKVRTRTPVRWRFGTHVTRDPAESLDELLRFSVRVYCCIPMLLSQLLDELEEETERGGAIVEYHAAELFPERWFDLVLVMRTDNSVLHSRLSNRQAILHTNPVHSRAHSAFD